MISFLPINFLETTIGPFSKRKNENRENTVHTNLIEKLVNACLTVFDASKHDEIINKVFNFEPERNPWNFTNSSLRL